MATSEIARFEKLVRSAAAFTIFLGVIALIGWTLQIGVLISFHPALPRMVPNAAVAVILAGFSLWTLSEKDLGIIRKILGIASSLLVALFGLFTLAEHLGGFRLSLDDFFFHDRVTGGVSAGGGRASFFTGLSLLFFGVALLLENGRPRTAPWRLDALVFVPMVVSLLALIGFACNIPSFYGAMSLFPNTAVSLPGVLSFLSLGAGLLCLNPDQGLAKLLRSSTAGGVVARRLLLGPVLIPLTTGLGTILAIKTGVYHAQFASWLVAYVNIAVFTAVIWWIATLLEREGEERNAAERLVRQMNAELEQRVRERTAELQASTQKVHWLATFPERNPNPIIEVSGDDGAVHYANEAADRLFPDLQNQRFNHPYLKDVQMHFEELSSGKTPAVRRELTIDGRSFAQTLSWIGENRRLRVYASDITDRKKAEEALLRERNLLRALIDHLPACIYVKDLDGRFVVYNTASVALTGVGSEAAALGSTVFGLFPPEIARVYAADDEAVIDSQQPIFDREEPTQDSKGEKRYLLTTKIPLRDAKGVIGILGISQDITERKESERLIHEAVEREHRLRLQAQASEDRFRTLVERSLVGIYVIQDERFAYANPAMARILGYPSAELESLSILDTVAPVDRARVKENIAKRLKGELAEIHYSIQLLRRDGTIAFVEVSGSRTEFNGRPAILGTVLDVSERRAAEEKVQRLNEELEARVRQRTAQLEDAYKELEAFSYSVSHDLRAPLRHIHGYGELLKREIDSHLSDDADRFMKVIINATAEMGQLIDDLLAFSRITRVELRESKVDLNELVQETLRSLEFATQGRNIEWQIAHLPPVQGDASTLKQVLVNLIGNAVKYTRNRDLGRIEIGFGGVQEGMLMFFVRDNGAGFDMQYADKLFGVFQRLHAADEFEGTGIGLATVRRIVQRHGGRTWGEGVLEQGATFYFTLRPATEETKNEFSEENFARGR